MVPLHDDQPTRIKPIVTVGLIVACSVIFLWQLSLSEADFERAIFSLGMIPSVLIGPHALPPEVQLVPNTFTVLSSMFLHGGFMHLAGNMLYLWIFGNNIEDAMGHVRFVVFYLVCGVAAVFSQALPDPDSVIPMIGASGAISGVLGAYLLLYPHARVLVVIPFGFYFHSMSLKAGWVLIIWFGMQLVNSMLSGPEPGVAWYAHIGGFVAGLTLIPFFKRPDVGYLNRGRITGAESTENITSNVSNKTAGITPIKRPGSGVWGKSKNCVERNCPHCHGRLRLPAGRSGIVDCPLCSKAFEVTT